MTSLVNGEYVEKTAMYSQSASASIENAAQKVIVDHVIATGQ